MTGRRRLPNRRPIALQHRVDVETIKNALNGRIAVALDHFTKVGVL